MTKRLCHSDTFNLLANDQGEYYPVKFITAVTTRTGKREPEPSLMDKRLHPLFKRWK